MMQQQTIAAVVLLFAAASPMLAQKDFSYLQECDPYYPGKDFPKLTTPMWLGEEGVDAVVVLSIDDMRDPEKYERFLRPVIDRLKKIDGRGPVSIFAIRNVPEDQRVQQFLDDGLSIEIHTATHPCPLLRVPPEVVPGDPDSLRLAVVDYLDCVATMNRIPRSRSTAYRMPCCDSRNTVSPRFFSEIFPLKTEDGDFLTIDSSVFLLYSREDDGLRNEWVTDEQGRPRFNKYVPFRNFANTIANYAYPYVIDRTIWEFPAVVPSDWEAQNLHQPNNPATVTDWKRALDVTVHHKGVMTMCFHPHNWIQSEQLIELIDYAESTYGKRVTFLNFAEVQQRLDQHLLAGQPLRNANGDDNGVRLVDVDQDGYLDVVIGNADKRATRLWDSTAGVWREHAFPARFLGGNVHPNNAAFYHSKDGVCFAMLNVKDGVWKWSGDRWIPQDPLPITPNTSPANDPGVRFRDLNSDGRCDLVVNNATMNAVYFQTDGGWSKAPFALPAEGYLVDANGVDQGLRFVDLDGDSDDDFIRSNGVEYAAYVYEGSNKGWSKRLLHGPANDGQALPPVVRNGVLNGVWFHSNAMFLANEFTATLPDLVVKRTFEEILSGGAPAAKSAGETLATIRVPDEFEVELVASEPHVADPVCLAFDAQGRLWVAEMGDYPLADKGGRIRLLEDLDHDGSIDKSTVFAEVGFPTGVLPWRKGVLVTAAPNIWYFEDTDGDRKADVQEVLYSGFAEGNQQHRVNGLHFGLDNWVYAANGDSGGTVRAHRGNEPVVTLRRQDFRIDPDRGAIEQVTGTTQFGLAMDDWGNRFGCNNRRHLMQSVFPERYLSRNPYVALPNPVVDIPDHGAACEIFPTSRPMARFNDFSHVGFISSACGLCVYRADQFPADYHGNVFVCEPVSNLVHRDVLEPNGAAEMVARRAELDREFFTSTDTWCRPVYTTVGPDGGLYVVDMYRLIIEHPKWIPAESQKRYDLRAGHDRGRIYRIKRKDEKSESTVALDEANTDSLASLLAHPNAWHRETAQQQLLWRKDSGAAAALRKLIADSQYPQGRLHALYTLDGLGELTAADVESALEDHHPWVRVHALRLAEGLADFKALADKILRMVEDGDRRVRYQAALTLGQLDDSRAAQSLTLVLVQDHHDMWTRSAVLSSSELLAAQIARRLIDEHGWMAESSSDERLALLGDLAKTVVGRKQPADVVNLLAAVCTRSEPSARGAQISLLGAINESFASRRTSLSSWLKSNEEVPDSLRSTVAAALSRARAAAADSSCPVAVRQQAVSLLGGTKQHLSDDVQTLVKLVAPSEPASLQKAALRTLDRMRDAPVADPLLERWSALTPDLRSRVASVLLSRSERAEALLDAIEEGVVSPSQLDASTIERLTKHREESLRDRAEKLLRRSRPAARTAVLKRYRDALKLQGDPGRGREVFKKTCANCHRLAGVGHDAAPNLTESRNKTPEYLLESILDPNKVVDPKYVGYMVLTESGRVVTGLIKSETSNSIELHKSDGETETLLRSNIERLQGTGKSLMPEGLEKDVSVAQMADVIAFVRSQGPARREFPGSNPELVTSQTDGSLRLNAANCEIFGKRIVLEQRYQNLGYWSDASDHVVWTVQVPTAGRYAVLMHWACDESCAGNRFVLSTPDDEFHGVVPSTRTWDNYEKKVFGNIELQEGRVRITMRPLGRISGSLVDLKEIVLSPVDTSETEREENQ